MLVPVFTQSLVLRAADLEAGEWASANIEANSIDLNVELILLLSSAMIFSRKTNPPPLCNFLNRVIFDIN